MILHPLVLKIGQYNIKRVKEVKKIKKIKELKRIGKRKEAIRKIK